MFERKTREHVRLQRRFPLRYRLPWSREWHMATTRDISAGGLSFVAPKGFVLSGLPVELDVDFSVADFRTRGRVMRMRRTAAGREIGVSFQGLPSDVRETLARYTCLAVRSA